MRGTPAVTTLQSRLGARLDDSLYVFVRGDNGRLYTRYWDGSLARWLWADLGQPATARVNSSPGVHGLVRSSRSGSPVFAFVRGNDGRLYERHWNGTRWLDWIDHGKPNVASIGLTPAVGSNLILELGNQVDVVCWAGDTTGSFFFHYARIAREWRFLGVTETGADIVSEPAAFADWTLGGPAVAAQHTTMYGVSGDGHLHRFIIRNSPGDAFFAPRDLQAPSLQGLAWLRRR